LVENDQKYQYWLKGALEDLEVAKILADKRKVRHSLYFGHLVLEKILKSCISKSSGNIPPRIHNLLRLSEMIGLELTVEQTDLLSEMNVFNLAGRYPDVLEEFPDFKEVKCYLNKIEEMVRWLINQFFNP